MKKVFIFFTILLASLTFSQEFILTENNYKLKDDNSKNYVVIDFPGKTKSELFSSIKKYITDEYKESLDKNYKELENEQIIFDALSQSSRTIFINKKGANVWKVLNRYEINFKDNKIMIRPTFINLTNTDNSNTTSLGAFFNSRGILRLENASYFTEAYANTFVKNLSKAVVEKKDNDW